MKSSRPPVILLNMAVDIINERENEVIISRYVQCVSDSGAVPMLIPSIEKKENIETLLDLADGVVFIGGRDYDPHTFGEERHPMTQLDRLRPSFDLVFGRAVLERRMPVLGICAGCQLLSIINGGKLIQHLDNAEQHRFTFHRAEVSEYGWFARAVKKNAGETLEVNSFHHQAVDPEFPGTGMKITARAFDGSVEAIELAGERMVLGVQFHPERMNDAAPDVFGLLRSEAEKFRSICKN